MWEKIAVATLVFMLYEDDVAAWISEKLRAQRIRRQIRRYRRGL